MVLRLNFIDKLKNPGDFFWIKVWYVFVFINASIIWIYIPILISEISDSFLMVFLGIIAIGPIVSLIFICTSMIPLFLFYALNDIRSNTARTYKTLNDLAENIEEINHKLLKKESPYKNEISTSEDYNNLILECDESTNEETINDETPEDETNDDEYIKEGTKIRYVQINTVYLPDKETDPIVIINEKYDCIGEAAFKNNKVVETIYIPESIKSIRIQAFIYCSNLKNIHYQGTKEQWDKIDIADFNNELFNAKIHFESDADYTNL